MVWREDRETGVLRNEGGNATEAHVVRVGNRYAWNVTHRDRVLAGGWSSSLEGAKDTAEERLIVAERAHTDEDDPRRPRRGRSHHVDPYDRTNGEHVKGHWAANPRRRR